MARKSVNRQVKAGHRAIGKLGCADDCITLPVFEGRKLMFALGDSYGNHGNVRTPHNRIGEVSNLPDELAHWRSCAALIAKKHQEKSQKLRNLYNAMFRRELTVDEITGVFAIWRGLYGIKEDEGPFPTRLAGSGARRGKAVGVVGGCPSEDNPEPDQAEPELDGDGWPFADEPEEDGGVE